LRVSGQKETLFAQVMRALEEGTVGNGEFEEWLTDQIEHGHNRQLFFSHLTEDCARGLSNIVNVRSCLARAELPTNDFSNILTTLLPKERTLTYLKIITHEHMVSQIKLCFSSTIELEPIEPEGPPRFETDFAWAIISPPARSLCIKVRPRGNQIQAQQQAQFTFIAVRELLNNIFNFSYMSAGHFKVVLYNIFKSLTAAAELPYQRRLLPFNTDILEFTTKLSRSLGLPSPTSPVDIPRRISKLFERALIQYEFDQFRSSGEGKRGIIDRFYYSDRTGAQVTARAPEDEGIELADIYFDTRDSIDKLRTFDKLWVTWFRRNSDETHSVRTRLEAHYDYYVVHFYSYLFREVEDYVLREVRSFESMGLE
ncbi:MAG: hypothetical protein K6T63_12480, partial [Alicyclobacillus herbarius]|uniref:hypothetical protein n=1 Tax=Alicyclobacillus herbarius TaxID=122960 RepID=UPI00235674EC